MRGRLSGWGGRSRREMAGELGRAEQAGRAQDQHDGHDQEGQRQGELRERPDPESGQLADQERGQKRAGDAAETPDHDHDENIDDDAQVHVVGHGIPRQLQGAAERREPCAEREHRGEQPGLIDAQRPDHLPILGGGAHENPPTGAAKQQVQRAEHGGPERDQDDLVLGKPLAEDRDRAGKARRPRPEEILRPPDHDHQLADDQHDAEGREQLEQLRRRVDASQQQDLDQRAEPADDHRGEQHAQPEAERRGAAA